MNRTKMLSELVDAAETLFGYVDAIPDDIASNFPAMPGCDRDAIEGDLAEVKKDIKKMSAATVSLDGEDLVCAIRVRLKHNGTTEFIDWLAGQKAIADSTGFISAAFSGAKDSTDAYYRYPGDPKGILEALPKGQSYVWMTPP